MLFLFNSAFRLLYKKNVLNTLCLPEGFTTSYRYRCRGSHVHVDPQLIDKHGAWHRNEEVLIVYVDRFAKGGYRFIPIRKGESRKIYCRGDRCFFNVSMGKFVSASDVDAFNEIMRQKLADKDLPRLIGNDPENGEDGYYALRAANLDVNSFKLQIDDQAWAATVDEIAKTQPFDSDATGPYFLSCRLLSKGNELKVSSFCRKYSVHRGGQYELEVAYRYPMQLKDRTKHNQVEVTFDDALLPSGDRIIPIDSHANVVTMAFAVAKDPVTSDARIGFKSEIEGKTPDCKLETRVSWGPFLILQTIMAIILFALAGLLVSTNKSELANWHRNIERGWLALKFGGLFFQSLMILWLFRLLGRKAL